MNKTAFLDIIHHVSSISDQEVAELEKLAASFPFCQTAHLLLAKAAYDQGSMLSNQKLRRAAACAANRQLLKKLIYTAAAEVDITPIAEPETATNDIEKNPGSEPELKEQYKEDLAPVASNFISPEINVASLELPANIYLPEEVSTEPATAQIEAVKQEQAFPEQDKSGVDPETGTEEDLSAVTDEIGDFSEIQNYYNKPEVDLADNHENLFFIQSLHPATPYRDPVTDFIQNLNTTTAAFGDKDKEEILAEHTRIEGQPGELNELAYILDSDLSIEEESGPEDKIAIEEDSTILAFDAYLFKPEKEIDSSTAAPDLVAYQEEIIYKIFDQNELGYWMDSSRLGETLQMKNELTPNQPFYFQPDLMLEYSKQNYLESYSPPAETSQNPQFKIIDQFLKQNPKLKSMNQVKIKAEPMEDLSLKSSKIKKNLASENLANIMVKQGKIKKAIKIYEHLILKIPEKKAYFASQIEKLQKLT